MSEPLEPFELSTSDLDTVNPAAIDALADHLAQVGIFWGHNRWIYFHLRTGEAHVEAIDPKHLAAHACSLGLFQLIDRRGAVPASQRPPYTAALNANLMHRTGRFPQADGIYSLPALAPAAPGQFRAAHAGFINGTLYAPRPATPVLPEPVPNYPLLNLWLTGMRFATPEHEALALTWTICTLARPLCPIFPMLLIDGQKATGKSQLAEAIAHFIEPAPFSPFTYSGDETEFEKRLASKIGHPGPALAVIDNVRPKRRSAGGIRSQFLAAATTSPRPALRQNYGKTVQPLDFPLIIMTMNDAKLEHDLNDRVVKVVCTDPERYYNPYPPTFVRQFRPQLISEAMHLLTSIKLTGEEAQHTRFGLFEHLATRAAAILNRPINFSPDHHSTADVGVRELIGLLEDMLALPEHAKGVTFVDMCKHIRRHADEFTELYSIVLNAAGQTGAARAIDKFHLEIRKRQPFQDSRGHQVLFGEVTLDGRKGLELIDITAPTP